MGAPGLDSETWDATPSAAPIPIKTRLTAGSIRVSNFLLNSSVMPLASLWIAMFAYLLGSVPVGYLLVRIFRKQDIRTFGSGNIGATNVLRSGGKALGAATFLLDVFKGSAAVSACRDRPPIPCSLGFRSATSKRSPHFSPSSAICFPCGCDFSGGKGVATGFGVFLFAAPWAALASIALFAIVFALTRYVSLASILGAASFPLFAWFTVRGPKTGLLHRRADRRGAAHHRQASSQHPPALGRHGTSLRSSPSTA